MAEVRGVPVITVLLFLLSCNGGARDVGGRSVEGFTGEEGVVDTEEQYTLLETFRENPLDPATSGVEALQQIPRFPARLAERIAEEQKAPGSRKGWIKGLTPPEMETLYRFADFLVLPRRRGFRLSFRGTVEGVGLDDSERAGCFLTAEGRSWRAIARGRAGQYGETASWYLSCRIPSGSIRLHAGDFMPDLSMGLLFSGFSFFYPFGSGFPLRDRRWIAGSTSFYSTALRGAAAEAWSGRVRLLIFHGRSRDYKGNRLELGDRRVSGGRCSIDAGMVSAGISAYAEGGERFLSVDYRLRREKLRMGGEVAIGGKCEPAAVWGFSTRLRDLVAGFLYYSQPYGLNNRYGDIAGTGGNSDVWKRGLCFAVEQRIHRGVRARASLEHSAKGDAFEARLSDIIRLELEGGSSRLSCRVSYSPRRFAESATIPYPGIQTPAAEISQSVGLLARGRFSEHVSIRISARFPYGGGYSGGLISSSIDARIVGRAVRMRLTGTLHRAYAGVPVFHFYEPLPAGIYPWKTVSGDGARLCVVPEFRVKTVRISGFSIFVKGKGPVAGCVISADL